MSNSPVTVLHAVTSDLSLLLLRGQLRFLKIRGFEPIGVCSPGPHVDRARETEEVPVYAVPMQREISPARDVTSLLRLCRLIHRVRPTICNTGTPKAGLLVGLAAWLNLVPCRVYTLRGLRLETAVGLKRRILQLTERIACGCAHRVICVSPSLRRRAIDLGLVSADKAVVLASGSSNGVDISRFVPTPARLAAAEGIRRRHGIPSTAPVIGYVGRFTRDKGLPELIAAFQVVRSECLDAVLMTIGGFESGDSVPAETQAAIDSGQGIVRVEFPADIEGYYLAMDMLVLPTHREGFPNVVLEAQAAAKPVITTYATGAVDSISCDVSGLLVPTADSDALAAAIMKLLKDPLLASKMGQAGRERVENYFRQDIVWGSLAELYSDLLTAQGLPVPQQIGRNNKSESPIAQ